MQTDITESVREIVMNNKIEMADIKSHDHPELLQFIVKTYRK